MKKIFFIISLFFSTVVVGQTAYIKLGAGLRVQPFYPNIPEDRMSEFKSFYLNPDFLLEIGLGYQFRNDVFAELYYKYFAFNGVEEYLVAHIPQNYPVHNNYFSHTYGINIGVKINKFSVSLLFSHIYKSNDLNSLRNSERYIQLAPSLAYKLFENESLFIKTSISPVHINSIGIDLNPVLYLNLNYKI